MSVIRLRGNPIKNLAYGAVPVDYRDYVKVDDNSIFGHYYKVIEGRPFNCVLGQVAKWVSVAVAAVTAIFTGGAAAPLLAVAAYADKAFKIVPPEVFSAVASVASDKWRNDSPSERDLIRAAYKDRFDALPKFTGGVPSEEYNKGWGWRAYRIWASMPYDQFKARFAGLAAEIEIVKGHIKTSPCTNWNYRDLGALLYLYQYGQIVDIARTSQTSEFILNDGDEVEFPKSPDTQIRDNSGLRKLAVALGLAVLGSQG